ncbi:UDP-glucose 4-epimerase GalE [Companilactobacillus sp.]|jgi:UDP-glucose 4-epimerase|uniref:UDP-glucose 4-epimerase GalE n=1 Tax=Companilactobacillus sp. TaxID=2767905 RepID=UPI0025C24DD6|nr:UDP-glucose 4-epimerase GalE [Companilactobacillus sp.]MCH4008101.1 UDP-glucose 4-epimerase GalE [Companilactobacillus sp.]MCH4051720.1 UDP-glucose 4-epimerase GalE [Companilactobacillus sp.]MCH4076044.1 UDP-glucose 4-epimerase GalE [Companilactobacillus sp.]MCH4124619.1 UDP-glucose 4-epimerase GalE [Companilactobacillus sp.]MCH4132418.1 UDP-glucose 4-epimerase GalE [Companilactobacillus sp.]
MSILVLGGAGYIGSHTVDHLCQMDYQVVVADNLATGHKTAINPKAKFYQGDVRDKSFLNEIFQKEDITDVIHFAAFSIVPESMKNPLKYFDNNTYGMISLLEAMNENDVKHIVFSSTAATYGEPKQIPIKEIDPTIPTNPYGESKLAMEKIMHWSDVAYGIKFVALRYFNVAGAKADGSIGEDHHPETHLIPVVLEVAAGQRDELTIFGDDYDTKDGTNVRDYVHVEDLAEAHRLAMEFLRDGNQSNIFNLGSSNGFSNKEILSAAREVTQKEIPATIGPRRAGDPSTLIAASDKARKVLGWEPKFDDVHKMIQDAWNFKSKHLNGYQDN